LILDFIIDYKYRKGVSEMVMTSEERLIKALRHEEVDRIPSFEWIIDKKVINAIKPGATEEEFVYAMDLDAICVDLNYKTEVLEPNVYKDEWGMVKKDSGEGHAFPLSGPINCLEDLRKYNPPDPHAPERYKTLEEKLERHKDKKAVILHLNDVFSLPSRLMVYEEFMVNLALEPEFIGELIDMTIDVNLEMAKEAVKRGVKFVYTGDDVAYVHGPLMSPKVFRNVFYPRMCRVIGGYKDLGLYVIKHTDGDIMPIIDMIIDSGIDCLDPIDPIARMDLALIKEKYGKRIAIKGNVDCSHTLTFGSVEDTIKASKKCIKIGAPGSGYIFSSSNSIHSAVKPDNYLAMLDTLKKYGQNPIPYDSL
jgi:uroporphyrinogen decarboxylase